MNRRQRIALVYPHENVTAVRPAGMKRATMIR